MTERRMYLVISRRDLLSLLELCGDSNGPATTVILDLEAQTDYPNQLQFNECGQGGQQGRSEMRATNASKNAENLKVIDVTEPEVG